MSPGELKKWRTERDLTQGELAMALSVHRVTVAKWEAGMIAIPKILDLALKGLDAMGGEAIPRERKRKRKREVKDNGSNLPTR